MSRFFPSPEECGHHIIFGNIPIRTYAGDHLQMSLVEVPEEGVVDWHQHPQEQMGMVVSGRAIFYVGEESKELAKGDMYFIPGSVRHRVVAVPCAEKFVALDIFYPIRPEYC